MPDDAKDVVAEWRTGRGAGLGIVDMYGTGDDLCAEVERLRLANRRMREVFLAYVDFHQSCEDHHRDECENPETCVGRRIDDMVQAAIEGSEKE